MAEFVKVCSKKDILENSAKSFVVNSKKVAVFNIGGKFYCIGSICPHAGGPLEEGYVENTDVECPWHGSRFNLVSGKVDNPPAEQDVEKYELKVEGEEIFIKL